METLRCGLIVTASPRTADINAIELAVASGKIHSVILYEDDMPERAFTEFASALVTICQQAKVPVLIANNSQVAGRSGADGIMFDQPNDNLADAMSDLDPGLIVGFGGLKDRHTAMEVGELDPDFVFFGKLGADSKPQAHPRNLKLASWWADVINIPCIVMAGASPQSVIECAKTGADFVSVERALFNTDLSPQAAVDEIHGLLEAHAPRFEEQGA